MPEAEIPIAATRNKERLNLVRNPMFWFSGNI